MRGENQLKAVIAAAKVGRNDLSVLLHCAQIHELHECVCMAHPSFYDAEKDGPCIVHDMPEHACGESSLWQYSTQCKSESFPTGDWALELAAVRDESRHTHTHRARGLQRHAVRGPWTGFALGAALLRRHLGARGKRKEWKQARARAFDPSDAHAPKISSARAMTPRSQQRDTGTYGWSQRVRSCECTIALTNRRTFRQVSASPPIMSITTHNASWLGR